MQEARVLLEHECRATTYKKRDKSYVSEEGREFEIVDLKPSKWSPPIQVVRRGIYHSPVIHQATTGIYIGASPLWRISHTVSRFATQIERLKMLLPSAEHQLELDIMIEEVSDEFHAASSEIRRLSSKLRKVVISSKLSGKIAVGRTVLDDELMKEKKKVEDFEKLWKYRNNQIYGLPILHYACLEGMSPFIIDMLVEEFGKAALESMVDIGREVLKKIGLPHDAHLPRWTAAPIHLAMLCNHVWLVKHCLERYPECIDLKMVHSVNSETSSAYGLLPLSAFASFSSFQIMKEVIGTDNIEHLTETIVMALRGGNLNLIQRLPSFCSLSFEELFNKDGGLLCEYWFIAARGGHLSVMDWIFKNFYRFSAVQSQASLNGNHLIEYATMDPKDPIDVNSLEYRQSFWKWSNDDEVEMCELALSHLPTMDWICKTSALTKDECYYAISTSMVPLRTAENGYEDTFRWLSESPYFDPSFVDESGFTAAHFACQYDSDGILQILFDRASKKCTRASPLPDYSFFDLRALPFDHIAHIAASRGSLKCLKWMTTHMEEFKGKHGRTNFLDLTDGDGSSVLHLAARSGNTHVLSWLNETFEPTWTLENNFSYQPFHSACNSLSAFVWLYETAGVPNLGALTKRAPQLAWLSASNGNFEVLDFIVSKFGPSCLIYKEKRTGLTIVSKCIGKDIIELLEWLRKVGFDFFVADRKGNNLAHRLAKIACKDEQVSACMAALVWLKAHTSTPFQTVLNNAGKSVLDLLFDSNLLHQSTQFNDFILKITSI